MSGGKKVEIEVEYPKGKEITDTVVGKYSIYEGATTIKGASPRRRAKRRCGVDQRVQGRAVPAVEYAEAEVIDEPEA